MKTLNYGLLVLTLIGLMLSSCQKDNLKELKAKETIQLETFFDDVSNMDLKIDDDNVIYIDYKWDKANGSIELVNVVEKEPDFFVIVDRTKGEETTYTVYCENGENSWTQECPGKYPCSQLIGKCLDESGCATICQGTMVYVPQIKSFFIGRDIKG